MEILGRQYFGIWITYAYNLGVRIPASIVVKSEPNGGQLYTFQPGPGITSFSIFAPVPPGGIHPTTTINPAWGVAEVSFTPANAPEPSSLIIAGLGALAVAARFGLRLVRLAA